MKRQFLMIAAMSFATASIATESGHCDSKPFTLKKSVASAPKAAPSPAPAPTVAAAPKPQAPAKAVKIAKSGKSKPYVLGCKQAKG